MGIGFALGGIAKGISDQQELGVKNNALKLQTAEMQNNNSYRNAMLGLEQQRVKASGGIEAANQARQIYDGLLSNVKDVITAGLKAGTPVDKLTEAIKPQVAYMQTLAPVAGIDTSAAAGEVTALLNSGVSKTPASTTDVMGPILQDFADGKPLSKTKKALLDNYFKQQSLLGGAIQQSAPDLATPPPSSMVPDVAEPAPAAAPAPAPAAAAPAPVATAAPAKAPPPIPKSLVGKQPHWSPSEPSFFFLADGTITDLQGTPVGKINGAAQ